MRPSSSVGGRRSPKWAVDETKADYERVHRGKSRLSCQKFPLFFCFKGFIALVRPFFTCSFDAVTVYTGQNETDTNRFSVIQYSYTCTTDDVERG